MSNVCWILLAALILFPLTAQAEEAQVFGRIRDAQTGQPLAGAEIWKAGTRAQSDETGHFSLPPAGGDLIVRALGYRALRVPSDTPLALELELEPFLPRALYLSFWGADSRALRLKLQQQLRDNQLNALVIDIKSSRGHIAYRSNIPLAREIGAQQVRPLKDLPEFLTQLKAQGIYTIARIVVFKDDLLARNHPELAAHTATGQLWLDCEKLGWTDPFNSRVRDYNLAVAEEAAQLGFDELQFDYIRFPAHSGLVFSREVDDDSRVSAINGFLDQARQRLAEYPVYLSANIFGYICWKPADGQIGQRLVDLASRVDYLSPMLYPSGFQFGVPGYRNPVANPFMVVAHSLQQAQQNSGLPAVRFRPWLQAFRDYAYDRRAFKSEEIHAQINASDANGSHGWMLWNPASRYSPAGLQQSVPDGELKLVDVSPKLPEPPILTGTDPVADGLPQL
jgi:hypothetical protein